MTEDPIITIDDIVKAGHCASGARRYFNEHGMDFRAFMREGIRASEFIEKGDALAARVVARKLAREEAARG